MIRYKNNYSSEITNFNFDSLSVIDGDTNTVGNTIAVGESPRDVAYNPHNGNMYVTYLGSNSISEINSDSNTVIDTIFVGMTSVDIAYNSDN